MNVCIDQGNTTIKIGLFSGRVLLEKKVFKAHELSAMYGWVNEIDNHSKSIILSSVAEVPVNLNSFDADIKIVLDAFTSLPILNKYQSPETLGKDRLANAVAAWSLNENHHSLVIDCGTCIKYDLITKDRKYIGGAISPGLEMRYQALNYFTGRLPKITSASQVEPVGTDTESAIRAGVELGTKDEIKGFIERYTRQYQGLTIFMTGGDLAHFDKAFKNSIFANPDLTLIGLNEILLHHAEKN